MHTATPTLRGLTPRSGCGKAAPMPAAILQKRSPASGAKWEEKPWNDTAPAERGDLQLGQSHEPAQHEPYKQTRPHN